MSFWEALARRLVNVYIYVYAVLFLGWLARVASAADMNGDGWVSWGEFYERCRYGVIGPGYILAFEFAFMITLSIIVFVNWKGRNVSGEIRRRDPNAPRWPI